MSVCLRRITGGSRKVLCNSRCSKTTVCACAAMTFHTHCLTSMFYCRNINHETLDAFMCNECGHSRFGRFELSMSASPCVSYPPILSHDDMLRALACLEHSVNTAQTRSAGLSNAAKYVKKHGPEPFEPLKIHICLTLCSLLRWQL